MEQERGRKDSSWRRAVRHGTPALLRACVFTRSQKRNEEGKSASTMEKLGGTDEMLGARAAVNESTISSLALNAEEDFEVCNAAANTSVLGGQR